MEHYLINPVNPLEKIRIPGHSQTVWRGGTTGRFGFLKGKMKRTGAKKSVSRLFKVAKKAMRKARKAPRRLYGAAAKAHAKKAKRGGGMTAHARAIIRKMNKSGILTSLKELGKSHKENPLMLVNKRRKSHKKVSHKRRTRRVKHAFAFNAPKRRTHVRRARKSARRFHRNPKFLSFKKGSASMNAVLGVAYAFGGGVVSTIGMGYITKMLPAIPALQTPLARVALRLGLAAGLYQLHRVKFIGKQNALFIAVGAALPVVQDIVGMVGAQQLLPMGGVGILPREYRSGQMSLIMPPQNMAGGGEAGW